MQQQQDAWVAHDNPDLSASVDQLGQHLTDGLRLPDESVVMVQGQQPEGGNTVPPIKRKRGRPKKVEGPKPEGGKIVPPIKRKRGRPPKVQTLTLAMALPAHQGLQTAENAPIVPS